MRNHSVNVIIIFSHREAIEHAKNALIYAQDDLLRLKELGASLEAIKEKVSGHYILTIKLNPIALLGFVASNCISQHGC